MAVDRLLPISTTPGAVTGDAYMDAVQEEVTALWNTGTVLTLSAVSGTDTITATLTPALTAGLANGMNFVLRAAATNTTTVTLNINGGGAVAVVDGTGTALTAGAIRSGGHYLLNYNSTSTHFRIVGYTPSTLIMPMAKLLATVSATSTPASFDFFNGSVPTNGGSGTVSASGTVVLDDTYDTYELVCSGIRPTTDDVEARLVVGTGGTPTYQATLYTNHYREWAAGGAADVGQSAQTVMRIGMNTTALGSVGNASLEHFNASIRFDNPDSTSLQKMFYFHGSYVDSAGLAYAFSGGSSWASATAITAVRFLFESGTIAAGRATLYGFTKA